MLMKIVSLGVQVPRTVNLRQWRRLCTGAGNLLRFCFACVRMGVYEEGSCEYVCSRVCICLCVTLCMRVCVCLSIEVSDVVNVTGRGF